MEWNFELGQILKNAGMDPPGGVGGGGVSTPQLGSRPKLGGAGGGGVEIFTKMCKKKQKFCLKMKEKS